MLRYPDVPRPIIYEIMLHWVQGTALFCFKCLDVVDHSDRIYCDRCGSPNPEKLIRLKDHNRCIECRMFSVHRADLADVCAKCAKKRRYKWFYENRKTQKINNSIKHQRQRVVALRENIDYTCEEHARLAYSFDNIQTLERWYKNLITYSDHDCEPLRVIIDLQKALRTK